MVTDLILAFLIDLVNLLLLPLPVINLPVDLVGGLAGFIELLDTVTFIIPVNTLISCLVWVIALHNKEFIMSIINWLIKKIPGLS